MIDEGSETMNQRPKEWKEGSRLITKEGRKEFMSVDECVKEKIKKLMEI